MERRAGKGEEQTTKPRQAPSMGGGRAWRAHTGAQGSWEGETEVFVSRNVSDGAWGGGE